MDPKYIILMFTLVGFAYGNHILIPYRNHRIEIFEPYMDCYTILPRNVTESRNNIVCKNGYTGNLPSNLRINEYGCLFPEEGYDHVIIEMSCEVSHQVCALLLDESSVNLILWLYDPDYCETDMKTHNWADRIITLITALFCYMFVLYIMRKIQYQENKNSRYPVLQFDVRFIK